MDKKKTPTDRSLRSDHPRKKLRNRSATPKSNPESSATASKKVSSSPKKKCQEKQKPAHDEVQLKAKMRGILGLCDIFCLNFHSVGLTNFFNVFCYSIEVSTLKPSLTNAPYDFTNFYMKKSRGTQKQLGI